MNRKTWERKMRKLRMERKEGKNEEVRSKDKEGRKEREEIKVK